jgi:hypothetical protein
MGIGKRKTDYSNRLPELKWDVEIGKHVVEERTCNSDGVWENVQRNADKFRGVFDLPNLQVGYIAYIKGVGRDTALKPLGEDYGPPPSDKHQEGLRLLVKLDASLGGGVCEFVSTLSYIWQEIDRLHDAYLAEVKKHEGCLPAVDVVDTCKKPGRTIDLLIPIYGIVGWVPRPPELPVAGIPIFRPPIKKKPAAETANGNGSDSNYTRPKPADDAGDELLDKDPFQR